MNIRIKALFAGRKAMLLRTSHYSEKYFSLQWDSFFTIVRNTFHYSGTTDEAPIPHIKKDMFFIKNTPLSSFKSKSLLFA